MRYAVWNDGSKINVGNLQGVHKVKDLVIPEGSVVIYAESESQALDKFRLQQEEKEINYYTLTRDEFSRMIDDFYQVQSAVRILEKHCFDIGNQSKNNENMLDVANCLMMVKEKLKPIENLLSK